MGIRKTKEDIEKIVKNSGYILLKEYIPSKGKSHRIIIQDEIGYRYDTTLSCFTKGQLPEFVGKGKFYSLYNIALWLKLNNPEIELCKDNVYESSGKKLKFYHIFCREYFKSSWDNIFQGQGCSICHGLQIGKYNNLAYKFPKIAAEWHPTKNGDLTPDRVTCNSGKRIWWICKNSHEYYARIGDRTTGHGCHVCANERKESEIATEIKSWCKNKFKRVYHEEQDFDNLRSPKNGLLRFDIFIEQNATRNAIFIEIHGYQHYKLSGFHYLQARKKGTIPQEEFEYSKKLDKIKKQYAKKYGQYIEVDLRKIKTVEQAISYIERKIC